MKKLVNIAAAAAIAAGLAPAMASVADYTWMSSPEDSNWNTTSLNWNSGEAWVDNASEPNNAIFGNTSQTTVNVVGNHVVSNLTISGPNYDINDGGSGSKLSIAGTITLGSGQMAFRAPIASGRPDGSLHITGNDWKIGFFYGGGNLQKSTYIEGNALFAPSNDGALGVLPTTPTDNIIIDGTPSFFASSPFTINSNRTMRLTSGSNLKTGSNHTFIYKNRIVADNTSGYN